MIFNSLGSNYNFKFVIRSLFSVGSDEDRRRLEYFLGKKYSGRPVLFYKGREAIRSALDLCRFPKGSKVGVNGFTCFVVYKAIIDAGCEPVYLDIANRDLNFNSNRLSNLKDLKALIVQNTLGNPVEIDAIQKFCQENGVILIEDLAHSAGTLYENGKEAGTVGNFTALSFSQDKITDAVSGGALIIRNKKIEIRGNEINFENLPVINQIKDRFYPFLTFIIRKLYPIGIGKLLHHFLKNVSALSDPLGKNFLMNYYRLPNWYCNLILSRFSEIGKEISHRKSIANIYAKRLNKNLLSENFVGNIDKSSNVRFPIFITNRKGLISFLKNNGFFVSDIWYDAPIAPAKLMVGIKHPNKCREAEKISKEILNLPTHLNITAEDASKLAGFINQWANTNQS